MPPLSAADLEGAGFKISKDHKIINLLARVASMENLVVAYDKIKSKPGNITPGITGETLDGMRMKKLEQLAEAVHRGRFQFMPARRVMVPKKNGGERLLSIPSPKDKIVHQAIRQQLRLVFDPLFSDHSHGFRPKRGCHRAFNDIKMRFGGIN